MNVQLALKLKVGQRVYFPADRGSQAGNGIVANVGTTINKSFSGAEYVWVGLLDAKGVWPSNRLSLIHEPSK